jgi:hypothetical protein
MTLQNNRLAYTLLAVPLLLLVPLIAMQFTPEVNWSPADFLVMGALLLSAALIIELISKMVKGKQQRILLWVAIVIVFLLVWAELAVGVFGTPFAGS